MKHRLRLSGTPCHNDDADHKDQAPAPLSFHDACRRPETAFPSQRSDQLVDDVLRSLDRLSITLDDLRKEIDALDDDPGPTPAA